MGDWWDELEADRPEELERKSSRLARVLENHPGSRALKVRWCRQHVALLEAEADAGGKLSGRQRSGEIVRLTIRWYRHMWKSLDGSQKAQDREQAARERDVAVQVEQPALRVLEGGQ